MTGDCFWVLCNIVDLSGESTTSRQHGNKPHLILMFLLMPRPSASREEAAIEAWFREQRLYPRLVNKI